MFWDVIKNIHYEAEEDQSLIIFQDFKFPYVFCLKDIFMKLLLSWYARFVIADCKMCF